MVGENREVVSDSRFEGGVGCCLEARRDVVKLRDQWPKVEYVDQDGVVSTHTFDWHITLANGQRHAIAARPFEQIKGLAGIMDLIRKQRAHREYADGITILTERDCSSDDVANAKLVLRARRHRDNDEMQSALTELRTVNGSVLFGDLVRKAPVEAIRRIAMWNLIDFGILMPVTREKITDRTRMWVNHESIKGAFA